MSSALPVPADVPRLGYSIAELTRTGIGRKSKIYELIASGSLPARMCGGTMIVTADDLAAYIASLPTVPVRGRAA